MHKEDFGVECERHYIRPFWLVFTGGSPTLFGLGRGPITPLGPAMVRMDRKDLNSNKQKMSGISSPLVTAIPCDGIGGSQKKTHISRQSADCSLHGVRPDLHASGHVPLLQKLRGRQSIIENSMLFMFCCLKSKQTCIGVIDMTLHNENRIVRQLRTLSSHSTNRDQRHNKITSQNNMFFILLRQFFSCVYFS